MKDLLRLLSVIPLVLFISFMVMLLVVLVVRDINNSNIPREHGKRMIECNVLIEHTPPEDDRHIDALVWLAQHEACGICPKEGE